MTRRYLAGSRVLITGASSGIGRELARALARRQVRLVLVARRKEKLDELAAEIIAAGSQAEMVVGDVTQPDLRTAAVERAQTRFGGLDILVNNAGVGALGRFDEASTDRLRQVMEVNFFALAEMTRTALPLLVHGRRPLVVNVSSILGHRGIPLSSEYCASKFAVQGLSESIRAELAARGVDVLVVSPGTTETEFFSSVVERRGTVPWAHRRGVPADKVARAIVRAMERGRHEIVPSFPGRILCWLNRFVPRFTDFVMERLVPREPPAN